MNWYFGQTAQPFGQQNLWGQQLNSGLSQFNPTYFSNFNVGGYQTFGLGTGGYNQLGNIGLTNSLFHHLQPNYFSNRGGFNQNLFGTSNHASNYFNQVNNSYFGTGNQLLAGGWNTPNTANSALNNNNWFGNQFNAPDYTGNHWLYDFNAYKELGINSHSLLAGAANPNLNFDLYNSLFAESDYNKLGKEWGDFFNRMVHEPLYGAPAAASSQSFYGNVVKNNPWINDPDFGIPKQLLDEARELYQAKITQARQINQQGANGEAAGTGTGEEPVDNRPAG